MRAQWFKVTPPSTSFAATTQAIVLAIEGRIAGGAHGGWDVHVFRIGKPWTSLRQLLEAQGCEVLELPKVTE